MNLFPLPEYLRETDADRWARHDRFVDQIKREIGRGATRQAFETSAYVHVCLMIGALHEGQAISLLRLIRERVDAPVPETSQESLF